MLGRKIVEYLDVFSNNRRFRQVVKEWLPGLLQKLNYSNKAKDCSSARSMLSDWIDDEVMLNALGCRLTY